MAKKALITGISGQDGAYLAQLLLSKGYEVFGMLRRSSGNSMWRLDALGIADRVRIVDGDLAEYSNLRRALKAVQPSELYNLAAQSFVGTSFEQPLYTGDVTGLGAARLLEVAREIAPDVRFYQASTSELYGKVHAIPQTEDTPFHPRSPYAVAKAYAHWFTINYRESYGLFACCGILFNHESPLRSLDFVTRRVTSGLARLKAGANEPLVLGNIDSKRDWGYAAEYVEGMWRMLQASEAEEYVLATGRTVTVRQFIEFACAELGFQIEWDGSGASEVGRDRSSGRQLVRIDPARFRPAEVELLVGDASKARDRLGWIPSTTVEALAAMMVRADYDRIRAADSA